MALFLRQLLSNCTRNFGHGVSESDLSLCKLDTFLAFDSSANRSMENKLQIIARVEFDNWSRIIFEGIIKLLKKLEYETARELCLR